MLIEAQMKIKILEKLPDLQPPEQEETETFSCPKSPSDTLLRNLFSSVSTLMSAWIRKLLLLARMVQENPR